MMLTNELLNLSVQYHLNDQASDGSFLAGHNGPYMDPEKPTRNTAHFLLMLSKVYEVEPKEQIKNAADRAVAFLFGDAARPHNATFYCRDKKGKDHCNGLIGQAWVMEALIEASIVFDRPDYYKLAEDIFLLHRWNEEIGIWHRVEIDGTELTFDATFNHQLWFAAVAAQLTRTPDAQRQALEFLRKVASRVNLYSNGVIFHASPLGSAPDYLHLGIRGILSYIKRWLLACIRKKSLYSKSVGYHGFNLYAYAMLKEAFPEENIWKSVVIKRMMEVVDSPIFQKELLNSEFGYFYNVSGIEIAYAMEMFRNDTNRAQSWLNRQFDQTYQDQFHPLIKGAVDENTAIARLYELQRLKHNYEVNCRMFSYSPF